MRRKRTLTGFVGAGVWRKREANAGKINSMKTKIKLAIALIASALLTGCQSWMGLMLIIGTLAFTGCTSVRDAVPATQITGNVGGKPFSFTGPKDLALDTLHIEAKPDGSVTLDVKGLNARTNPDVITTTGDAQAKITKAQGDAVVSAFQAGGAAAGAAIGAAAKTP